VKVVVKKVDGWNNYEFVSIIPAWQHDGYTNMVFFEENELLLKISTKKVIQDIDDYFSEVCTESE